MRAELERATLDLQRTKANVKELQEKVAVLKADGDIKQAALDELTAQSNMMTRKLNTAEGLVRDLSSEKKRWSLDMVKLQEDKIKLVGDCLLGSAFLSYCGPFNYELRNEMIYERWFDDIR